MEATPARKAPQQDAVPPHGIVFRLFDSYS